MNEGRQAIGKRINNKGEVQNSNPPTCLRKMKADDIFVKENCLWGQRIPGCVVIHNANHVRCDKM